MATKKTAQQDQPADDQAQTTADAKSPALEPDVAALLERTEADREAARLEREAALAVPRQAVPAGVIDPRPTRVRIILEDMHTSRGGEPLPTVISGTMTMRINGQSHHTTFEASGIIAPGVYEILAKVTPF